MTRRLASRRARRAARRQRGAALAAVLLAMALLLPLGALALLQARAGALTQQSLRGDVEALHAADGALACALAALPPLADAALLGFGPDGGAGTADDGVLPFAAPCPASEARIRAEGGGRWVLSSSGRGTRGATRTLELRLRRSALPFTAAAVAHAPGTSPAIAAECRADGGDHRRLDAVGSPTGTAAPVAAIAAAEGATALAAAVRARHERVSLEPHALAGEAVLGTSAAPQLTIVAGDLDVADEIAGSGVLVIDGLLRLRGGLRFDGLLAARDGIIAEPGAVLDARGAVWSGNGPLELRAQGAVVYCAECLASADAAFPGLLPHAFEPAGWREP